jgi:hypothetical protein
VNRLRIWWSGYWYEPAPPNRLDAFARIIFATVILEVLTVDDWARDHARVPDAFYRPVHLARLLHLPAPTPTTMALLRILTVLACAIALLRIAPRLTSAAVLAGNTVWILWAFSYGKVDHDRLTITFALFVLALTRRRGVDVEARTGWALRMVQVAFALAYPFSALVKLRTAGFGWANSAVFTRAIVRRGTGLGDFLLHHSWMLHIGQWAFLFFEIFAVVLLCRNSRLRAVALVGVVGLHAFTYATIGISFLPHTVCIVAFLPLERIGEWWARRGVTAALPEDQGIGVVSSAARLATPETRRLSRMMWRSRPSVR